ncbi:hypothetical protein ACI2JA_03605 [Alkalihalobacillus sp. NPDC078783]
MKIIKIINQHRRDFTALYECEGCSYQKKSDGYDDRHFHDNVVPSIKCDECKESRNSMGIAGEKVETKYQEGFQV